MNFIEFAGQLVQGGLQEYRQDHLPDVDARSYGLKVLREFMSRLVFARTGAGGQVEKFKVPKENIFSEQPDEEIELRFPAISVLPTRGEYVSFGLGPPDVCPDSIDKFGPNTALLILGEYDETITIELWGSHRAERRALIAGLTTALRLSPDSQSLHLIMDDYYGLSAEFLLTEGQRIDDFDVVRGRRRAQLMVDMRVPDVILVNRTTLIPIIKVELVENTESLSLDIENSDG